MLKFEKEFISYRFYQSVLTALGPGKAEDVRNKLERILGAFVPESTVQHNYGVRADNGRYYIRNYDAGSTTSAAGRLSVFLLSHVGQEFSLAQLETMSGMRRQSVWDVVSILRKALTKHSHELSLATIKKNPSTYAVVERDGKNYKL